MNQSIITYSFVWRVSEVLAQVLMFVFTYFRIILGSRKLNQTPQPIPNIESATI